MPKPNRRPSNRQVKTIDELHSGQNAKGIGMPLNLSLTISCHIKIANGFLPPPPRFAIDNNANNRRPIFYFFSTFISKVRKF